MNAGIIEEVPASLSGGVVAEVNSWKAEFDAVVALEGGGEANTFWVGKEGRIGGVAGDLNEGVVDGDGSSVAGLVSDHAAVTDGEGGIVDVDSEHAT